MQISERTGCATIHLRLSGFSFLACAYIVPVTARMERTKRAHEKASRFKAINPGKVEAGGDPWRRP